MAKLAIRGHETRGKEVIELLEMLGGKTSYDCGYKDGFDSSYFFFIDEYFYIDGFAYNSEDLEYCYILTLEEFIEMFPYKVGDKVSNIIHNENQTITKVAWDFQANEVIYQTNGNEWVFVNYLQPYKEETMEEKLMPRIDLTGYCKDKYILDLGNYKIKEENGVTYMIHKKPQYPKTYEECCRILELSNLELPTASGYGAIQTESFQQLRVCRDAYWKIAGEQMGLGKPWEPDWIDVEQDKYVLFTHDNAICSNRYVLGHNILAFPTAEMRDAFYEYFKDLIEQCKELL